jgi:hypothetical protein
VKVSQRKEEEGCSYSWGTGERCCSSWATHLPTPTWGHWAPLGSGGDCWAQHHRCRTAIQMTQGLLELLFETRVPSSCRAGAQPSCVRQILVTITKDLR